MHLLPLRLGWIGTPVTTGTVVVVDEATLDVPDDEAAVVEALEVVVAVLVVVVVADEVVEVVVVVVAWRAAKWLRSMAETIDTATKTTAMILLCMLVK